MKKYNHPIDDFFRKTLQNHEMAPSDAAKKAFLKDVMEITQPKKNGRKGIIFLSGFLALVGAGIILWTISSGKFITNPAKVSCTSVGNSIAKNLETGSEIKKDVDNRTKQNNINVTTCSQNKKPDPQISAQKSPLPQSFRQPEIIQHSEGQKAQPSVASTSNLIVINDTPANGLSSEASPQIEKSITDGVIIPDTTFRNPIKPDSASIPVSTKTDSIVVPGSRIKKESGNGSGIQRNLIPSIGVYYTPEWMFNTLEGTKFVNNFGIEGAFYFGRFSVRTGAGLSIARGTNELIVEYNDFLGAYNKLDSMNFTWNDPTHNYLPTMYTSKKDVWDSLMKLDYAKVVKRYTYLQVPMILGYDFWQSDLVTLGMRMGPVMSIKLASKQLSAAYDPGTKRIISINDIAPEQVSLNWQVMAGFNSSFRLTRELQFEVEPSVRYYFNSVYEKPVNNTKPWSAGIRAAFVVTF